MSEKERDREVAAAWREASREEPPPALDDAIRAQARRAVGAAPEGRRRHREWRYPAAAAATVAVLAFGIARMTSRDPVEPVIVADQAARPPAATAPSLPREEKAAAVQAPVSVAGETTHLPQRAADAKVASAPPPAPAAREPPPPRTKSAPVRKDEVAPNERFAAPPPSALVGKSEAPAASNLAAPTTPAEATAREASPDAPPRDVYAQAPQRQSPADSQAEALRAFATAPMPVAKVTNIDEAKAKQAGAESVEAWIARIRDLKSRGDSDAAAKELAKFRETYGVRSESLLPEDLRAK